jgi:hypothetical protein
VFKVNVKAGLKMKRDKITFVALLVASCLGMASLSYGQEAATEQHDDSKSSRGGRVKEFPKGVSDSFKSLDDALKAKNTGTLVFSLEKEKDKTPVTLDLEKINSLRHLLIAVKDYAEKMKKCLDENKNDLVSQGFLLSLNKFVDYVKEQEVLTQTNKTINEKDLNSHVVVLEKAFEEKSKIFESAKGNFEASDKKVKEALIGVAKVLQNGDRDKTAFDTDSVERDLAIKAIKESSANAKMCKLDETATTDSTANNNDGANNGSNAVPPVVDPSSDNGTGTPRTPNGFIPANPIPNGNAIVPGDFRTNQLEDLLRRTQDDRDRERLLNEKLLRSQRDDENRDSAQALKALQQALEQAQRPNVSRGNSDRSEQGPQISPSVSISPSQQQPPQPMQLPPVPPPQPLNLGSLFNNGPTQPIIPYTPSRFNDDLPPRPAAPAQPDPTTTALLQTMQQQNQMFQQMLMNQNPNMNNGVANVRGTIGNAFQNFAGPRFSRGPARTTGRGRILPPRFSGNARSGVQGKIGANPSARGPLPSRPGR